MGLLDLPLISEMDEIERKARQGSIVALEQLLLTCSPLAQRRVDRLRKEGLGLKEAMQKAGITIVCVR